MVLVLDGELLDLVRDYDDGYDRRTHAREVRAALKRWAGVLTLDRPWRVTPRDPWKQRSMPFDAHFDDDFSFFFRTPEDMARFRPRYRTMLSMRLESIRLVEAQAWRDRRHPPPFVPDSAK